MVRRLPLLLAASILAAFALQNVGSMRVTSATSDETSHLPAGYSYLRTGDYRLNPQHPPLAKLLAGLPLLAMAPKLDLNDPGWTSSPPDEWGFGARFLYRNDADRLLFWGRLPTLLLGLAACVYAGLWARDLFGVSAGLAAAALWAFCPTVIAHAHLVTMDVPLAAFATASMYHLRAHRTGGRTLHLALAGVALGCALATKFSAVLFVPAIVVLVVLARRRPVRTLSILVGIAAAVVWASYAFPADPLFYWRGLRMVNQDHDPTIADYLLGSFRLGGFWYYFPVAFVLKTPLPALGVMAAGLATWRRFPAPSLLDEAELALPAAAFFAGTCLLAADIGVRYLIPLVPPLAVAGARVVPRLLATRPGRLAAGALALWLVAGAARSFPDEVSYFNEAAGGAARGPYLLDDSNLDWGGGLKRLKSWMDARGVESVRLLYPWNGSPEYYGIHYEPVTRQDWLEAPRPGLYAISPEALVRGRQTAREEGARSDWLDRYRPVERIGGAFWIYRFDAP